MKIHGIGTLLLKLLVMNMLSFFFLHLTFMKTKYEVVGGPFSWHCTEALFFYSSKNVNGKNCHLPFLCHLLVWEHFCCLEDTWQKHGSRAKSTFFQKSMVILQHWCIFCYNKFCQFRKRCFISCVHLLFASWYLAVLLMLY